MRKVISTDGAPAAIGPYVQAIKTEHYVFVSGQLPIDPTTGQLVQGGIQEQSRQALKNMLEILKSAGCSPASLVKIRVWAFPGSVKEILAAAAAANATVTPGMIS